MDFYELVEAGIFARGCPLQSAPVCAVCRRVYARKFHIFIWIAIFISIFIYVCVSLLSAEIQRNLFSLLGVREQGICESVAIVGSYQQTIGLPTDLGK